MAKGPYRCSKCDRTFAMAAHLARHQSSHAGPAKRAAAKRKAKRARAGRKSAQAAPASNVARRPVGRPRGIGARLGLRNLSLEQLTEVISAARVEARRKLAELQGAIG